jgi:hypothetical protein
VRVLPYALSFTSASSTTPQTRPTRCTFTTCYSLSPLLCPWRLHGAIDTSICERGFSLMNLLKTAKRSRMGNELVPIAHADGRVQPGQRRGLERPYIPKSPWMPSLSCGVSSRATDGIRITMSSSQASSRCWKPVGTLSHMYLPYVSSCLGEWASVFVAARGGLPARRRRRQLLVRRALRKRVL